MGFLMELPGKFFSSFHILFLERSLVVEVDLLSGVFIMQKDIKNAREFTAKLGETFASGDVSPLYEIKPEEWRLIGRVNELLDPSVSFQIQIVLP